MTNKTIFLLISLFLALANKAICQFSFDTYAVHKVDLIDVNKRQVIENQTVVVSKGHIAGIFDSDKFIVSDTVQLLDFEGYYLSPGLIDAHVHLGTNPSGADNFEDTKKRLNYLLLNGVTTVRDMAGDTRYLSFLSRQALLDEIISPDIYYSALMAGGSFFEDPRTRSAAQGKPPGKAAWMQAISSESNFNLAVAEAKGTGATGIKIYANLAEGNIKKIVEAAHSQNMKVWAHSTVFPARPSEVCAAGVDVVSHSTYLAWEGQNDIPNDASHRHSKHENFDIDNPAFQKLMECLYQNNTILDATISVYSKSFPDSTLYNYGVSLTNLAYRNKVRIGVGTDIGLNLSARLPIFQEMAILQNEVGMESIDVIRAATITNAEILGEEDAIGSIHVRKKANLLLMKANPAEDISNFENIEFVIKNGKLHKSN